MGNESIARGLGRERDEWLNLVVGERGGERVGQIRVSLLASSVCGIGMKNGSEWVS